MLKPSRSVLVLGIFGYRYGDTDYRVSALPLGGYVKMSGENPGDEITGDPDEFMSKPKWQRFLVAFAGPAMNGVLAVVLLVGLYMYGTDVPEFLQGEARVGIVVEGSPAEAAGIQAGDLIVEFDGEENPTWRDVETTVILSPEQPIEVQLERQGEVIETSVIPERQPRTEAGYSGMGPHIRVVVGGYSQSDSPAERAGLLPGDEIVGVGEVDLRISSDSILDVIQEIPGDVFPITVLRGDATLTFDVEPAMGEDAVRMIGIEIPAPTILIKLGFVDAVARSIRTNANDAMLIFEILGRLIKRETSMRTLDGPIGIVNYSGQALQAGLTTLVRFMALISLNLGVINLLPIPILDGGVMLLLLIEGIMRQDLSLAVRERIVQVSFVCLLVLIVFVIYNDVVKLIPPSPPT